MFNQETGLFRDGNVPMEERDTFLRETGYMNPVELSEWEKDLVEEAICEWEHQEHEPTLEDEL